MAKEEIIRNLKYTMEKHKNDTVGTFGTNISVMCKDILDYLEQEPCEDCISRKDTLKKFKQIYFDNDTVIRCAELILGSMPPVTPQPKTGHWIAVDEEPHEDYECDKCGYTISTYTANIEPHREYKYCPNCGAKMAEPQKSEG